MSAVIEAINAPELLKAAEEESDKASARRRALTAEFVDKGCHEEEFMLADLIDFYKASLRETMEALTKSICVHNISHEERDQAWESCRKVQERLQNVITQTSELVNQSKLDSHYTTEFVCVIKMMERAIDVFNRPDILDYEIYNSFSRQLMACNEEIGKNEYLTARSEERLTSGYLILLRKASLIKG